VRGPQAPPGQGSRAVMLAGEQRPLLSQQGSLYQVIVFLREMKKKKQQNDSESLEPPEEKQKETETQPPPAPNTSKGVPAPQPIKRGQKVGRDQGYPWVELSPCEVWTEIPGFCQTSVAA